MRVSSYLREKSFQCLTTDRTFDIMSASTFSENGSEFRNFADVDNADTSVFKSINISSPLMGAKSSPRNVVIAEYRGLSNIPAIGPILNDLAIIKPPSDHTNVSPNK